MIDNNGLKKLIVPLILEQLLAVSVGMVDTIMVSTVGEVAVSGVALVDNINRLVIHVLSAFAAGGVVISSQYYGSGNMAKTRKSCAQLEMLMLIFSILTAVLCAVFSRSILGAVFGSVEADVMNAANIYLVVTALSYPFLGAYNAGAAILRSFGNSRISMNISIIMNIINVMLNALFVFVFKWGVMGVALATLAGRIAAGVIMKLVTVSAKNPLKVTEKSDYIPSMPYIKRILKIGIPSGIENSIFQIGKLMVISLVATLGTNAIAANAIAYQMIDFPNIPGEAIGLALVVIVGQNIGADDKKGAVKDSKRLLKIAYAGDWICKITLFIIAPVIVSGAVFAALKINLPLCVAPPILVAFSEFMRKDNKARQTPVKTVILIFICACAGAVCRYVLSEKLGSPLAVSAAVSSVLMLVSLHAAKMYLPPAGALAILAMLIPAEELIYYPAQVFLGVGAFMLVAILINRICKCNISE